MLAYAWVNGLIEFGASVPVGAQLIAKGPDDDLKYAVGAVAQRSCDGHELLVPGVREAKDTDEALDALARFIGPVKEMLWGGPEAPAAKGL